MYAFGGNAVYDDPQVKGSLTGNASVAQAGAVVCFDGVGAFLVGIVGRIVSGLIRRTLACRS